MALITAAQVISTAFTNTSTDADLIKAQIIRSAEIQYIRPALGDDLYALIVSEHTADVWTLLNETLYDDYVQPALAYYVKLLCLPDLHMNTTSQGIMSNNAEFSTQVSSAMRAELAQATKQIADSIISDMIKYIEDNDSSFPTYSTGENRTERRMIGGFLVSKDNDSVISNKQYPWRR